MQNSYDYPLSLDGKILLDILDPDCDTDHHQSEQSVVASETSHTSKKLLRICVQLFHLSVKFVEYCCYLAFKNSCIRIMK